MWQLIGNAGKVPSRAGVSDHILPSFPNPAVCWATDLQAVFHAASIAMHVHMQVAEQTAGGMHAPIELQLLQSHASCSAGGSQTKRSSVRVVGSGFRTLTG